MSLRSFLNTNRLQHKDLFDIRSFVLVFSIYSLISIWFSDTVYNNARTLKNLKQDAKIIKSEYVSTRTRLMTIKKQSYLLQKANNFGLHPSEKLLTTFYLIYED